MKAGRSAEGEGANDRFATLDRNNTLLFLRPLTSESGGTPLLLSAHSLLLLIPNPRPFCLKPRAFKNLGIDDTSRPPPGREIEHSLADRSADIPE
jgi:hypothetical protein